MGLLPIFVNNVKIFPSDFAETHKPISVLSPFNLITLLPSTNTHIYAPFYCLKYIQHIFPWFNENIQLGVFTLTTRWDTIEVQQKSDRRNIIKKLSPSTDPGIAQQYRLFGSDVKPVTSTHCCYKERLIIVVISGIILYMQSWVWV